jgi:fructose-specific phosphotransferase system IIC component
MAGCLIGSAMGGMHSFSMATEKLVTVGRAWPILPATLYNPVIAVVAERRVMVYWVSAPCAWCMTGLSTWD